MPCPPTSAIPVPPGQRRPEALDASCSGPEPLPGPPQIHLPWPTASTRSQQPQRLPLSASLTPPVARRLLPGPSHYIPSIHPPPPTSWGRSALGPGSRAPRHAYGPDCLSHLPTPGSPPPSTLSAGGSRFSYPRRTAHPSCPRPPGSRSPLTATSVRPPPAPRPAPAGAPLTPTAPAPGSPPHRPPPQPGVAPPSSRHTQEPLALPSGLGPGGGGWGGLGGWGMGPGRPVLPTPAASHPLLWPQSRPHPTGRKPSAPAPPPTLSH